MRTLKEIQADMDKVQAEIEKNGLTDELSNEYLQLELEFEWVML
jgi:hypothetical protein